mmetsp:Transcript_70762/g.160747  ORF Transcript_70762/g.160747 Transcript_70762/m.160747 type:complete len:233 (+) Transcript_70762:298-996(+)
MPVSRAEISSAIVSIVSVASSAAFAMSATERSSPFISSSVLSSSFSQYALLSSSSACSLASSASMSLTMVMTLSKLTFRPWRARAMKLRRTSGLELPACPKARRVLSARCLTSAEVILVWRREGLGRVFLKSCKASSSFRIRIVSPSVVSSSARVFCTASHSSFFVLQVPSMSARNFLSAANDAEVSSRSSFRLSTSTLDVPFRTSFDSSALVLAAISCFFAATSESYIALA